MVEPLVKQVTPDELAQAWAATPIKDLSIAYVIDEEGKRGIFGEILAATFDPTNNRSFNKWV